MYHFNGENFDAQPPVTTEPEDIVIDPDCDQRFEGAIRFQRERNPQHESRIRILARTAIAALGSLSDAKVRRS